jgi:hypothetical protein
MKLPFFFPCNTLEDHGHAWVLKDLEFRIFLKKTILDLGWGHLVRIFNGVYFINFEKAVGAISITYAIFTLRVGH